LADTGGGNIFVSGDLTHFVSAFTVCYERGLLSRWAVAPPSLIL